MSDKQGSIIFEDLDGNEIKLEVLEQTTIAGQTYLLVSDDEEDTVMLLKEVPEEGDYVSYDVVEDDDEIEVVLKIFNELLDDMDIEF